MPTFEKEKEYLKHCDVTGIWWNACCVRHCPHFKVQAKYGKNVQVCYQVCLKCKYGRNDHGMVMCDYNVPG